MHVKNLEAAKVLAENLLDTIAAEFGASRSVSLEFLFCEIMDSFALVSFIITALIKKYKLKFYMISWILVIQIPCFSYAMISH
jgi:hypothetical protein